MVPTVFMSTCSPLVRCCLRIYAGHGRTGVKADVDFDLHLPERERLAFEGLDDRGEGRELRPFDVDLPSA
jgi:hypothetical protein